MVISTDAAQGLTLLQIESLPNMPIIIKKYETTKRNATFTVANCPNGSIEMSKETDFAEV